MKIAGWQDRLKDFFAVNTLAGCQSDQLRHFLVELYQLLLAAPYAAAVRFDSVSEPELEERARYWWDHLSTGYALPPIDLQAPLKTLMADLGGLLRACDIELRKGAVHLGCDASADDWIVGDSYLIPRKKIPHWREPKKAHSIRRRGMLYHRLVPREIGGLQVTPVPFGTISDRAEEQRLRTCAAMFSNFEINLSSPDRKSFRALSTNEKAHRKEVIEQLKASAAEDCFSIVWPELTIPLELREVVRQFAVDNPVAENLPLPDIIVPGSWHEVENGKARNVARIYDRFGKECARHEKIVPYFDGDHGDEEIEAGEEIQIIVTDDFLVAVAICKDFCGYSNPPLPFLDLNVDLILVPSMGDGGTLAAHQRVAEFLRVQNGGRAFIVQQSIPRTEQSVVGFVIPPEASREDDPIPVPNDGGSRIFNHL